MTIRELLTAISPNPVSDAFLDSIGTEVGVSNMDSEVNEVTPVTINRIRARFYLHLALSPNVSEGGVSISYTAYEKRLFLDLARKYAALAGEKDLVPGATYGYKGESL